MYGASDRLASEIGRRMGLHANRGRGRKAGRSCYFMETITGVGVLKLNIEEKDGEVVSVEFQDQYTDYMWPEVLEESQDAVRWQITGRQTEPAEG